MPKKLMMAGSFAALVVTLLFVFRREPSVYEVVEYFEFPKNPFFEEPEKPASIRARQSGYDGWLGKFVKHGEYTYHYTKGPVRFKGDYCHGARHGTWYYWYDDGSTEGTESYAQGKPHGPWTWYYQNGRAMMAREYNRGTLLGSWRFWDEEGRLVAEIPAREAENNPSMVARRIPKDKISYFGVVHVLGEPDGGTFIESYWSRAAFSWPL